MATKPKEDEEDEENLALQAKEVPGQTPAVSPAVENQINSLRGGGQPLSPSVRGFFEPRFGFGFKDVRVHTDACAAESARALNARAYAVGRDVVFGNGEYAPETAEGPRLLGHELAHVVQQRASTQRLLSCKKVEQYETKGIPVTGSDIADWATRSYWEQRIGGIYAIFYGDTVQERFKADAEERDAVLSVLWNVRPKQLKAETTRLVSIPARLNPSSTVD